MRILHLVSRMTYGGAAALVTNWVTFLHESGHQVEVCTVYSKGQFSDQLENAGIPVYSFDLDPQGLNLQPKRKYDFRYLPSLINLIRRSNYEIVHVHLFPTSLVAAISSLFAPESQYVLSEHSVYNRRRHYKVLKVLDWVIYHRYMRIIAVSDEVKAALIEWLPGIESKVVVVHNGIDPNSFYASTEDMSSLRDDLGIQINEKVLLYAGRLLPEKGADVLLSALTFISSRNLTFKVLIAGDGPLLNQLHNFVINHSLGDRVAFLGRRNDIPLLLNLADLVVIPSRWEGLPMLLLEAMAASKTVIATNVGGIPGVIKHKVNGWLIPPEDPKLLNESIIYLLENEEQRNKLGIRAFQTINENFSIETSIIKLIKIYNNLLN